MRKSQGAPIAIEKTKLARKSTATQVGKDQTNGERKRRPLPCNFKANGFARTSIEKSVIPDDWDYLSREFTGFHNKKERGRTRTILEERRMV